MMQAKPAETAPRDGTTFWAMSGWHEGIVKTKYTTAKEFSGKYGGHTKEYTTGFYKSADDTESVNIQWWFPLSELSTPEQQ